MNSGCLNCMFDVNLRLKHKANTVELISTENSVETGNDRIGVENCSCGELTWLSCLTAYLKMEWDMDLKQKPAESMDLE